MAFKFHYKNLEEIKNECTDRSLDIGFKPDYQILGERLTLGVQTIPNRLVVQPMEGFDAVHQGEPGELTFRRYLRYAIGGAGVIWFEAVAVLAEGRSNPYQLMLNKKTVDTMARLVEETKQAAWKEYKHEPFCIVQLTHSGRFSKPTGDRKPIIAVHDRVFDHIVGIDENYPVVTDRELERIRDSFVEASRLAKKAGFDAVDIKACHRYLLSELLAAKQRTGKYGGDYTNRTRLLKEIIQLVKSYVPELTIAVRLNATDMVDTVNSWGTVLGNSLQPDLSEPVRLAKELEMLGVSLLNITAGTPYYNPHVNRPYDQPVPNGYKAPEHPLQGVARLFAVAMHIQEAVPEVPVVGTGYSWLRQFGGEAAAYNVSYGKHQLAGFGRQAFAYPDFARDLLLGRGLKPEKSCITCSKCSQLMRLGSRTGCVVRDAKTYAPIFQEVSRTFG
ncbi:MAG: flavin oxidoreductase/NADH oxidase [Peptococcaceae bacterium]|nr:flavin oxidoreductase/NADH oxidase [Peptococcaceae bacterium]